MEKEPPEVAASGGSCIMMMQYVGWLSYLFPSNHLQIKYETIPAITEIINEIKESTSFISFLCQNGEDNRVSIAYIIFYGAFFDKTFNRYFSGGIG